MSELDELFEAAVVELRHHGDPDAAPKMAAYMKGHFQFLGVKSPVRKQVQKALVKAAKAAGPDDLLDIAERCWSLAEREFQYVGSNLLHAGADRLRECDIGRVRLLIETKSWWDTVDALAAHTVGPMVLAHPSLAETMDEWIDDKNIWIARTAILHQLNYKERTDEGRLFAYAEARAHDTEFFIRKALGWALRNYARVAPDAVRRFVDSHAEELSGLTKREATKHL